MNLILANISYLDVILSIMPKSIFLRRLLSRSFEIGGITKLLNQFDDFENIWQSE